MQKVNKLHLVCKKVLCIGLFTFFSLTTYASEIESSSISSNPAAVNITPGTGALQKYFEEKFGIQNNHGIQFDGAWLGDVNDLFSGGIEDAKRLTSNSLLILDMNVDTEKFIGWKGGLFDVEFLQFNGQSTNKQAGVIQGYNSLPAGSPLTRSQLYQLWYRQKLFNDKLVVRVGKVVPTFDFNNVLKPVPLEKLDLLIPAVSGLLYTPIFVNSSILGAIPGYYNSAYGITINITPIKEWYLSLGSYDGNLANGIQTGLTGPHFNGYYFNVAETGVTWLSGKDRKPGTLALGGWYQTGRLRLEASPTVSESGASGLYVFGSQRLWYKNPDVDISGISAFYQFGINDSDVLIMNKYLGGGLTAFGLVPHRLNDSMGIGGALAWLNQNIFDRKTELMFQAYYQAEVIKGIYIEPALSYIPTPGASAKLNAAWAGTLRAIVLF